MVAVENLKENKFEIKGIIALSDKIRKNIKEVIEELNKNQIKKSSLFKYTYPTRWVVWKCNPIT